MKKLYKILIFSVQNLLPRNIRHKVISKILRKIGVKVGENCRFYSTNFNTEPYLIEIGNNCTITKGVNFITHDGAVDVIRNLKTTYKNIDIFGEIILGDNVFIGNNVQILPGVKIGCNVVIGAGSIVTKSIDSNSIAAGNPAKVIGEINDYLEKYSLNMFYTKNIKNKKDVIFKDKEKLLKK